MHDAGTAYRGPLAIIAVLTVLLCMVAALTGFLFMKLSENTNSPEYEITDVFRDGEPIAFSGSMSFTEYDESFRESVIRFSFDIVTGDGAKYAGDVTVIIDLETSEPLGYRPVGKEGSSGIWTDGSNTLSISGNEVTDITVNYSGLTITAHRSP